MKKYNSIISDANISITNILIDSLNTDSNLKITECLRILNENLPDLQKNNNSNLFNRFKNAMLEEEEEISKKVKLIINATEQLNICNMCKCKTCIMYEPACKCSGCLLGAHVTECEGGNGIEVRTVKSNSILLNKEPVVKLEHNRLTGEDIVTTENNLGKEQKYKYNFSNGEYEIL